MPPDWQAGGRGQAARPRGATGRAAGQQAVKRPAARAGNRAHKQAAGRAGGHRRCAGGRPRLRRERGSAAIEHTDEGAGRRVVRCCRGWRAAQAKTRRGKARWRARGRGKPGSGQRAEVFAGVSPAHGLWLASVGATLALGRCSLHVVPQSLWALGLGGLSGGSLPARPQRYSSFLLGARPCRPKAGPASERTPRRQATNTKARRWPRRGIGPRPQLTKNMEPIYRPPPPGLPSPTLVSPVSGVGLGNGPRQCSTKRWTRGACAPGASSAEAAARITACCASLPRGRRNGASAAQECSVSGAAAACRCCRAYAAACARRAARRSCALRPGGRPRRTRGSAPVPSGAAGASGRAGETGTSSGSQGSAISNRHPAESVHIRRTGDAYTWK